MGRRLEIFERICEERFHKSILTQTETLDWIETFENVFHKIFTLTFSFMNEPTRCWSFIGFWLDVYLKDTVKIFHSKIKGELWRKMNLWSNKTLTQQHNEGPYMQNEALRTL